MAATGGFWSYVHADDLTEQGRIKQLADDVAQQYALITGEAIEIFLDRNALSWGDNWREKIDLSLASILFFVPVITPRFLLSSECRRELQEFVRGAERLGIRELVLPLVYADVLALHEESSTDETVALVKKYQWEDWRDLRFEDANSSTYRRAVARLAKRLADINQQILSEETALPEVPANLGPPDPIGSGDEPGTLDLIVIAEEAMPQLAATIGEIGPEIGTVGDLAQKATQEIQRADQQGKGFAARLPVIRRLAQDLSAPADHLLELANRYTKTLYEVDYGIRAVIAHAPTEVKNDPSAKSQWVDFANVIAQLAAATQQSTESIQGMTEGLSQSEMISRDLRPPLQRLRRGLTILIEGSAVIKEWKTLVDEAPVE
jgi:TIR domain